MRQDRFTITTNRFTITTNRFTITTNGFTITNNSTKHLGPTADRITQQKNKASNVYIIDPSSSSFTFIIKSISGIQQN